LNVNPRGHRDGPAASKPNFFAMVAALNESAKTPTMALRDMEFVFTALDDDGSGTLDQSEFDNVCRAIQYSFWNAPRYNASLERFFPGLYSSPFMETLKLWVWPSSPHHASKLDSLMTVVLLCNSGVVVAESYYDFKDTAQYANQFAFVETVFGLMYVGECIAYLLCMSWQEYCSAKSRLFDFCTTWILFGVSVAFYLPFATVRSSLMHYASILRLLRLIRVVKSLKRLPKVSFMFNCVSTLLASATEILFLLTLILYVYSTVSLQQFGGLLYLGNPKLVGTSYADGDYYVFNFNDLMMSMVMWFVYLLCENETQFAVGLRAALPPWRGGGNPMWLIFPLFYFTVVIFAFELVSAFIIETFTKVSDQHNAELLRQQQKLEKQEYGVPGDDAEDDDDADEEEGRLRELQNALAERDVMFHYTKSAAATKAEIYRMMFAKESKAAQSSKSLRCEAYRDRIDGMSLPALKLEFTRMTNRLHADAKLHREALAENAVPILERVEALERQLADRHQIVGVAEAERWSAEREAFLEELRCLEAEAQVAREVAHFATEGEVVTAQRGITEAGTARWISEHRRMVERARKRPSLNPAPRAILPQRFEPVGNGSSPDLSAECNGTEEVGGSANGVGPRGAVRLQPPLAPRRASTSVAAPGLVQPISRTQSAPAQRDTPPQCVRIAFTGKSGLPIRGQLVLR